MVFYHRSIPLSVSLREDDPSQQCSREVTESFSKLTVAISAALEGNPELLNEAWDYRYDNFWRHRWNGKPFHMCSPKVQKAVLLRRTYWYKRLAKHNQNLVDRLLDRGKPLVLKEILHTTDGILSSLLISFPEVFYSPVKGKEYLISDMIMNNLISHGLQRYDGLLSDLKSMRKEMRKAAFECREYTLPRSYQRYYGSWMSRVLEIYNPISKRTSKSKMFRVCVFTQSRATGLADQKAVNRTINEFIETVTHEKEFKPDDLLVDCIDAITTEVVQAAVGGNPQFRISMSTSACTENPKSKEGKFGHIKAMSHEYPKIPKFSPTSQGGQLGNWAFRKGLRMIESSDPAIFKTNIAGIRENGKCRVVTSGSFYKDAVLQPFSHMTIQAIKTQRSLRNGLSAGRLGWRLISRVDHLDPVDGHVLFEKVRRVYSVDWRKATDIPTHKSAHATSISLLEKMRTPRGVLNAIKNIWPGQKDLYHKGKYIGRLVNGVPMGDPMTKTNLSLAHPICERYATFTSPGVKVVHDGNGDDTGVILGADDEQKIVRWCEAYNSAAEMLGYQLSPEDTFLTASWGTYCEEVFCIPPDRFGTVRTASKLKDNDLMPYLDHPKMRLVIDTQKDRSDFSSRIEGKVTLVGKDMWYADNTIEGHLFSVASACQDVCLGVRYEQRPMYLPEEVFSVGKVPHLWEVDSWSNAILSQPGKVVNITVTAMKELMRELPEHLTLHRSVKSSERHFTGELVVEEFTIPDDDPIKKLMFIPRQFVSKFPVGVIERLVESKHLTTSKEVEAIYLFQKRLESLEQVQPVDLFENLRTLVAVEKTYSDEEVRSTVKRFRSTFYKNRYALRRPLDVDYYLTNDIDGLRNCDPRTVTIPGFDYIDRFRPRLKAETPMMRDLEQLYEWLIEWAPKIIRDEFFELPPVNIIEDDPLILQQVERTEAWSVIVIVTDDKKLVREAMNRFPDKHLYLMQMTTWVSIDADEGAVVSALEEKEKKHVEIIVDNGNLDAFLLKTDIEEVRKPKFTDDHNLKRPREQEEIFNVFSPPRKINAANVMSLLKGRDVIQRDLRRRGAVRRGR